jgi:hypothetical protein
MMYQSHFTSKKNKWRRFLQVALFVLAIISLAGCDGVQTAQIPASDTPLGLAFTTTSETPGPTPTPSSTETATPQSSWTPVPTLPVEIRKQNLIDLFTTNGGCDFPCWWGVSPGDPIQKVSELAPVVGESPNVYKGFLYSYTLSLSTLNTPDLDVNYHIDANQIVQHMEIILDQPSRFRDYYDAFAEQLSLASLLKRYGKPSEVLLLVTPRSEPGPSPRAYVLFLIYDVEGFGIVYRGSVDSEDPLRICSIKLTDYRLQSVLLHLQDPRQKIGELNRSHLAELQPLDEVTLMNRDEFHRVFSEPQPNQCIEISTDPWQ